MSCNAKAEMERVETKILKVSSVCPDRESIRFAADVLRAGGLVAFPTETVYGLGADIFNPEAVRKIFDAKGRPIDNPLIAHIADRSELPVLASDVPAMAESLAERFWPGPLTLVLRRSPAVPDIVSAGLDTIAVRMPDNIVAIELIRALGNPIAAPSANLSGRPSPTTPEHVYQDLGGKIDLILDAGPVRIGIESTVLDVTCSPPIVLRPGGLALESLREAIGEVVFTSDENFLKRSPGTRYRHYSPRARLILVEVNKSEELEKIVEGLIDVGARVGCIVRNKDLSLSKGPLICRYLPEDAAEYARNLFGAIRDLDGLKVDAIVVQGIEEGGLGLAVMDRLRRAASEVIR